MAQPRFNHTFTTHNFSGTKDYIVSVGLDFLGSSTSSTECILQWMRATTNTNNFIYEYMIMYLPIRYRQQVLMHSGLMY